MYINGDDAERDRLYKYLLDSQGRPAQYELKASQVMAW